MLLFKLKRSIPLFLVLIFLTPIGSPRFFALMAEALKSDSRGPLSLGASAVDPLNHFLRNTPLEEPSYTGFFGGRHNMLDTGMAEKERSRKLEMEKFIDDHLTSLSPFSDLDSGKDFQKEVEFQSMNSQLPSQAEYNALIDLYQATGGENWSENSGWSTADPNVVESIAYWSNIIVDANGHVTHIQMNFKNLTGELPSTLQNLTYLKWFRVAGNNLVGQLPEFTNMPELTFVELSRNNFSGSLPASYGTCLKMEEIHVQRNNITGPIPGSYVGLTKLKWLALYDNDMSGTLPFNLGNMIDLEYLYLYGNNFSGSIPTSIGNISNLEFIDLSDNYFSGNIPYSLGNIAGLKFLFLYNNNFSGPIPSSIGNANLLEIMWLYSNLFSGELPTSMGNLDKLTMLYAQDNELSGIIPESFGGMAELREVRLSNNKLSGSIPSSLCSLPNLVLFHVQLNELSGDVPLCLLTNVSGQFRISHNYYGFEDLGSKTQYWSQPDYYSPQRSDPALTTYSVSDTGTITLTTVVGKNLGSPSHYRWYNDGNALTDTSPANDSVTVNCPISGGDTVDCLGNYFANVTNPDYPTILILAAGGGIDENKELDITICWYELNPTNSLVDAAMVDISNRAKVLARYVVDRRTHVTTLRSESLAA